MLSLRLKVGTEFSSSTGSAKMAKGQNMLPKLHKFFYLLNFDSSPSEKVMFHGLPEYDSAQNNIVDSLLFIPFNSFIFGDSREKYTFHLGKYKYTQHTSFYHFI